MACDVIFQRMQRIGGGPIQNFYSTHIGRCWLTGTRESEKIRVPYEDPGPVASNGLTDFELDCR
jgi:hypothetical protein